MAEKTQDWPGDPEVAEFVAAAQKYCALIDSLCWDKDPWVEGILSALASLYAAGLRLPEVNPEDTEEIPDRFHIDHDGWKALFGRLGNFLGEARYYWVYFDPTVPPDSPTEQPESVCGCLADDLADIYRDVRPGLAAWDSNAGAYVPRIIWGWKFYFCHHWGVHAVDAMRALHRLAHFRGAGESSAAV